MIQSRKINFTNIVLQCKGNIVSNMGEEKVMLSIKNGNYYNLGEIGGEIWEGMRDPIVVSQLITNLIKEYDVEQVVCEEQVISFLENLYKEGLIQII